MAAIELLLQGFEFNPRAEPAAGGPSKALPCPLCFMTTTTSPRQGRQTLAPIYPNSWPGWTQTTSDRLPTTSSRYLVFLLQALALRLNPVEVHGSLSTAVKPVFSALGSAWLADSDTVDQPCAQSCLLSALRRAGIRPRTYHRRCSTIARAAR